ncbi:hypothetical protein PybrP1_000331 [[Pythium] brassicae (nom. inval.)]|nr:hypothetical protein PybrP1_000331 [[Pythium] brassicae (nom. inval.)]
MVAALSSWWTRLVAFLAASVLTARTADGTSLRLSPTTPLDDFAPLTHEHPAFGAGIENRGPEPVVFADSIELTALGRTAVNESSADAADSDERATRHRRTEATNRDIRRLEDFLGGPLERNFYTLKDKLSRGKAATIPWPSSYWAATDEFGRYTDAARRDINPSFLHLAAANLMGKRRMSFIVDVASDSEVWNQPVRSYRVAEMELADADAESLARFGVRSYPFNSAAKYVARTVLLLSWIDESDEDGELVDTGLVDQSTITTTFEYLLELDASHNVIGGEWLEDSRYDHPDFLWLPTDRPEPGTELPSGIGYDDGV